MNTKLGWEKYVNNVQMLKMKKFFLLYQNMLQILIPYHSLKYQKKVHQTLVIKNVALAEEKQNQKAGPENAFPPSVSPRPT